MSCLDKLTKLPKLDPYDLRLKAVVPSIIDNVSLKTRVYLAGTALSSLKTEITTQVSNQLANTLNVITGNSVVPSIGGIKASIKQFGKFFSGVFNEAKNTITKQYQNISDLITCEINEFKSNSVVTTEANVLQSSISDTYQAPLLNVTNSEAKNLLESTALKATFIASAVDSTISTGTNIIANSKSNKSINTDEVNTITSLGLLA